MYRNITMKEIGEQHIGQSLQVAGWVENIRDHGGVSFIDLRDMYGVLQVVIRKTELLKGIVKEMCLSIEGPVEKRDEETKESMENLAKAVGGRLVKIKAEYEIAEEDGSELKEPVESNEESDHDALDCFIEKMLGL